MDEFEKVEKLRQRANVSYEEAKKALEASNGDLLDAMIYLEKEGKTANTMSNGEIVVSSVVVDGEEKKSNKKTSSENGEKFKEFCKSSWKKGNENFFVVTHKSNVIIKIPVWAMIVLLIFTFHVTLPVMLISLFFGVRYSFMGEADFETVNKAMDKAGEYVDNIKDEFNGNKEN
ncbi:MAG: ubiquitin [Lachnospiraceae bacterium]|nr:ubiquitin [Lachnospiraceae bacterium]